MTKKYLLWSKVEEPKQGLSNYGQVNQSNWGIFSSVENAFNHIPLVINLIGLDEFNITIPKTLNQIKQELKETLTTGSVIVIDHSIVIEHVYMDNNEKEYYREMGLNPQSKKYRDFKIHIQIFEENEMLY